MIGAACRIAVGAALCVIPLMLSAATHAQPEHFAAPEAPVTQAGYGADLLPRNDADRAALLRATAFDATIFGMSAYLHYEQLYRQVFDPSSSNYTGFNRFAHDRDLAGPDYATFKVPNTDTLYSTAWIDLSKRPVEVDIPATRLKYFTLNIFDIFDIFGNPGNLSNRTIGFEGGRFLLVPRGWSGTAPEGIRVYRAATTQLWILMRAFAQSDNEVRTARAFQDAVRIIPPAGEGTADGNGTPPRPAPRQKPGPSVFSGCSTMCFGSMAGSRAKRRSYRGSDRLASWATRRSIPRRWRPTRVRRSKAGTPRRWTCSRAPSRNWVNRPAQAG